MYTEKELVRIAKRENNKKRNYLVVNRLQGKHIPVRASKAFSMFYKLADLVSAHYAEEKLLFVGFAETATAIGAAVAHRCQAPYIQTTREILDGVHYLFFSEEHSHATEQKLVREDMDRICKDVDRIVFVEDEVTTGKTILNIVDILNAGYPMIKKYAVASLLNGMDGAALTNYAKRGIGLHYLVKTDHTAYPAAAERFEGNGNYICCDSEKPACDFGSTVREFAVRCHVDARRLTGMVQYDGEIEKVWKEILSKVSFCGVRDILVLGTEEFMYPALRIAQYMEKKAENVRCHSTTRSPILVSQEEDYPLHTRYEIKSLYDKGRKNFLYDIKKYNLVFLITDAPKTETKGLHSLLQALSMCGNDSVYIVRWELE
ncbi:MAG: hypothetical protein HFG80_02420 [Eubacterium sp.]|nr:hypothetical protein [Eubacterium sp.]